MKFTVTVTNNHNIIIINITVETKNGAVYELKTIIIIK